MYSYSTLSVNFVPTKQTDNMAVSGLAHDRKFNFAAGPSALPIEVLEEAQRDMLNYKGSGISVMEMSHRSAEFGEIINRATTSLRELLDIPDNYKVLFMQGGGTGQFAAIAMNLLHLKPNHSADYIVTGTWSQKAAKEAEKFGKVNYVLPTTKVFKGVPDRNHWNLDSSASYIYYCGNETIHGIEFHEVPEHDPSVPLVCDMSSNMLTRPVDVSKYGIIYFGAQKNVGPAGVTGVIIREDLLGHAMPHTPSVLDYSVMAKNNSLYNTPPCYGIYMCGLVFDWIKSKGGLTAKAEMAKRKSGALYDVIEQSNDFYACAIDAEHRSRMNVTFRVGGPDGNDALEKLFLSEAQEQHMIQLKGHRSVGGMRASLYNAVPLEHVLKLAAFMKDFQRRHQGAQNGHMTNGLQRAQNGHMTNGLHNGH